MFYFGAFTPRQKTNFGKILIDRKFIFRQINVRYFCFFSLPPNTEK